MFFVHLKTVVVWIPQSVAINLENILIYKTVAVQKGAKPYQIIARRKYNSYVCIFCNLSSLMSKETV